MRLDNPQRLGRLAAAAVLILGPWFLVACDNGTGDGTDAGNGGDTTPPVTATDPGTGTASGAQDKPAFFANGDHIGEDVTVDATVDVALNEKAVVLNAGDYGDNSLLVLLDQKAPNLKEGDAVTATGTVEKFSYEQFSERYGLVQAAIYEGYANEEFLHSATVAPAEGSPTG